MSEKNSIYVYADSPSDEVVEESTQSGEPATPEDVDNTKQAGVASVTQGESSTEAFAFGRN